MDFLDELSAGLICGDGAMGTEILARGALPESCFEELVVSAPELIRSIHSDYLAAGSRMIETNTFGANAVRLARFGLEARTAEFNHAAARLARSTAQGKSAYVAGSVGPLGLGVDEAQAVDRSAIFLEQIAALLDGGVDVLQLETFLDLDEISLALSAAKKLSRVPVICSLVCSEEGRLASGTSVVDAFRKLTDAGADVVGLNCLTGPHAMLRVLERVPIDFRMSAFPNAGHPLYRDGQYLYGLAPEYFATAGREFAKQGVRLRTSLLSAKLCGRLNRQLRRSLCASLNRLARQ
jgi:methionine synthase I (cobalamin-dependent)